MKIIPGHTKAADFGTFFPNHTLSKTVRYIFVDSKSVAEFDTNEPYEELIVEFINGFCLSLNIN